MGIISSGLIESQKPKSRTKNQNWEPRTKIENGQEPKSRTKNQNWEPRTKIEIRELIRTKSTNQEPKTKIENQEPKSRTKTKNWQTKNQNRGPKPPKSRKKYQNWEPKTKIKNQNREQLEFQRTHTLCALSMHVSSVLHVQQVPRLVAVVLQCTARASLPYMHNTEAVAAHVVLAASPEGVVAVKAHKKIFRGQGGRISRTTP